MTVSAAAPLHPSQVQDRRSRRLIERRPDLGDFRQLRDKHTCKRLGVGVRIDLLVVARAVVGATALVFETGAFSRSATCPR